MSLPNSFSNHDSARFPIMSDEFQFDVFLSHSSKDKAVARDIAQRLKKDGVKVWFDEWIIKPGDSIPAKIEEGLEHSRVLVLLMSINAFGTDWAQLEFGTFRFRDPLNKERRFLPLRLDEAPIKGSLAQFLYINWLVPGRERAYAKLLETCRPPKKLTPKNNNSAGESKSIASSIPLRYELAERMTINVIVFRVNQKRALTGAADNTMRLWDLETGECLRIFDGHLSSQSFTGGIWAVAWSPTENHALSAAVDQTMRLWNLETGHCLRVFERQSKPIHEISWSPTGNNALSAGCDGKVLLWSPMVSQPLCEFAGHKERVLTISWSPDGRRALSGSSDNTMRLWNIETRLCERVFEDDTRKSHLHLYVTGIWSIVWTADGHRALSSYADNTVRLWDLATGQCLRVLEGHTAQVFSMALSLAHGLALSGSLDQTVRLWDIETGRCLHVLEGHKSAVRNVFWSADGLYAFSGDERGNILVWNVSELLIESLFSKGTAPSSTLGPEQVQYTNAKVLLVGESGAGKTGLSRRLALNDWQPSDSTVGAWATQWKLPVAGGKGVEREIWLWDFGGQADQRLIHQLYMDETALVVLVFDGQKEDFFETLGQWDRDLTRASRKEFAKLLVAGRVDAGGLRASRSEVENFAAERKFRGFLETSAKRSLGCEELKHAILDAIPWDELPCRTTEILFKRLKDEIIKLKDEGRVLMRFNELRETLLIRLSGELARFTDEELHAVLALLAGPGVVWELAFGSWVLLQPERINSYAQAVIRTLQADGHQRGCLMEERVMKGDLIYESSVERLESDEERFVLLAMHQTLVERGLCLRQPTAQGNLLIFPSYYRRERPDPGKRPAVLSTFRFTGFLDEIYATLVVRLHHTDQFQQDNIWRRAADFRTVTGKLLGFKLTRIASGEGELDVYFDPVIVMETKIAFCKYVHEHLLQHALGVERLRHYVCAKCGTPVGNREVAMEWLDDWLQSAPSQLDAASWFKFNNNKQAPPTIMCVRCKNDVPLWDELEQCFASPEIQQRVREMQEESAIELSNQSKERALVGEVISTVALADQISREFNVSDQGIDMEIEFNDDAHEATNRKLYLQLKSGDSYLRERKADGAEIFTIKHERHARYWMASAFPVLLVIRNSEGEVRWMEVRDWLKRASDNGKKPVKQIIFEGKRFDVMSVRRWRDEMLKADRSD